MSLTFVIEGQASSTSNGPSDEELIAEAQRIVQAHTPPPSPQPPPDAHVEHQAATESLKFKLPARGATLGSAASQSVEYSVDRPKLTGASPEETARWQLELNQRDELLKDQLKQELEALERKANNSADMVNQYVPMITAVAALLGAIASLVKALKRSAPEPG